MAKDLLGFPTHLKNPKKNVFIFCNSPGAKRNSHKKKVESSSSRIFKSRNIKISGVFRAPGYFCPPLPPSCGSRKISYYMSTPKAAKIMKQMPSTKGISIVSSWSCNWCLLLSQFVSLFHWNWFWIQVHPFVLLLLHLAQFRVPWAKRNWLPMMEPAVGLKISIMGYDDPC